MNKDTRDISTLKEWDKNPRSITPRAFERLKKQLTKWGQYKPLLITDDGVVLGGNMRLKAMRDLGWKDIWVSIVEADTEEDKIEYALSDNDRVGKYEQEDLLSLVEQFPEVNWGDYSVDLQEPELVSDFMDQFSEVEEDEVPAVSEGEPISKLGEVYELGRHRLMCGDATDVGVVALLMNGQKADMVFTDPPYGVDYTGGHAVKGVRRDRLENDKTPDIYSDSLPLAVSVSKDGAAFYVWYSDSKSLAVLQAVLQAGLEVRNHIIWNKNMAQFGAIGAQYKSKHEPLLYMFKKGSSPQWYGENNEVSVWECNRAPKNEFHPTQKPVGLPVRAIKNSSKQDDIVLDLFGGSGSTLIACEQTNRICYMMELDPKYCDVIRKRYENFINNREITGKHG